MEIATISGMISSIGIPGTLIVIAFYFSNRLLEKYFDNAKLEREVRTKELEKDKSDVSKLCDKIDKMSDIIHEFASIQVQKSVILEKNIADIKDMYIRIANKQDVIREQVQETNTNTKLCPNIRDLKNKEAK